MESDSEATKHLLITEYNKVIDILQSYDVHFLKMKTWGVTLSGIVLSIGIAQDKPLVLVAALILSLAFWITESWYKVIQNGHSLRAREIEEAFINKNLDIQYPRILGAYNEQSEKNRKNRKFIRFMFYSQVMFPHIFLVILIFSLLSYDLISD